MNKYLNTAYTMEQVHNIWLKLENKENMGCV